MIPAFLSHMRRGVEKRTRISRETPPPGVSGHRCRPSRRGFTLVEMLVTVTILAILAAIVFAAMASAENTAKIAKTKATVVKLHRLIMARYESYKTRRIPIDMMLRADNSNPIMPALSPAEMARIRLDAIREIMRMELPDRPADVINSPESGSVGGFSGAGWSKISSNSNQRKVGPTSIFRAYYTYWQQQESQGRRWRTEEANIHSSAECLYMIVTMSCPGGREQFSENEIADVDRDGWPEFIDGWGQPIYFCRWAPGFVPSRGGDSNLQSDVTITTGGTRMAKQRDPFDTQGLEPLAYQLIPLIYSGGPDGESWLTFCDLYGTWLTSGTRTPYGLKDKLDRLQGQPGDAKSASSRVQKHLDNIHNHRLEVR